MSDDEASNTESKFLAAPFALPEFPRRGRAAHKRSVGTVLVVAGSRGMSGAAYLAAKAALRGGAGLVTVACPEEVHRVLEVKTTCVMTRPLAQAEDGGVAGEALEEVLELARGVDAVAVGPGLGRGGGAVEVVRGLVERAEVPVVLDADGLNAFEGEPERLERLAERGVLTPHPGEFRRLSGCAREALEGEGRSEALEAWVSARGVTTLLKGAGTLVASPGEATWENPTGNPGMATGGTGDVLTGLVAALLAAGLGPFEAACLGAWLHGRAGDEAARRVGWAPLIATDVLEALAGVIRDVEVRG